MGSSAILDHCSPPHVLSARSPGQLGEVHARDGEFSPRRPLLDMEGASGRTSRARWPEEPNHIVPAFSATIGEPPASKVGGEMIPVVLVTAFINPSLRLGEMPPTSRFPRRFAFAAVVYQCPLDPGILLELYCD